MPASSDTPDLSRRAGSALAWRTAQHIGVQAIYLIRIPILARLLSPDDFGLMSIALVTLDVLLGLTDVGMVPALVQRDQLERRHYDVAWSVGAARALLVAAVVFVAAPYVATMFAEPRAVPIMRALAIRPLLDAAASIRIADLHRELRFRGLAFLYVGSALFNAAVSIALAPRLGVWALVAGALTGAALLAIVSYVLAPYAPRPSWDVASASSLVRFGRWILFIGVTSLLGRMVIQAVISRQLGAVELGLYYLAARIATAPSDVAYQLVGSVAFPLYARLQSDAAAVIRAFQAVLTGIGAILFPILVLIFVLAQSISLEVLGEQWSGAAPVIRALAVAGAIGLYGDALDPLFKGWGQPWKAAALDGIQTAMLITLVWPLTALYGIVGAAAAWIPSTGSSQVAGALMLRGMLPGAHAGLRRPLLLIAVVGLLGGLVAFVLERQVPGLPGLIIAASAGLFVSSFLMLRADRRFGIGLVAGIELIQPRLGAWARRLAGSSSA